MPQQQLTHAMQSSTLADVLERVLDKGIVIAGDIKIKLVDIELLSIQIRLVICSVDKAKEMGMDWWVNNPVFCSQAPKGQLEASLSRIDERLARIRGADRGGQSDPRPAMLAHLLIQHAPYIRG
jgi:hypothetical protein